MNLLITAAGRLSMTHTFSELFIVILAILLGLCFFSKVTNLCLPRRSD